jgi:hypothetical protein
MRSMVLKNLSYGHFREKDDTNTVEFVVRILEKKIGFPFFQEYIRIY